MSGNNSRKTFKSSDSIPHRVKKSKLTQLLGGDDDDDDDENDKENDFSEDVVNQAIKTSTKPDVKTAKILDPPNVSQNETIKDERKRGILELHVVGNRLNCPPDNQNYVILLALQSLFGYHLPNIPRDYMANMIFDPEHKSLALIKSTEIIGGICFRPFPTRNFAEITFFTITTSEQMRGYGTYLMNHFKDYVVPKGITHLLAFADLKAIGYFKKQGFKKKISLARSVYKGLIMDYSHATLMHCELNPNILYTQVSNVVQQQRQIVGEIMKNSKTEVPKIHQGLDCFKDPRVAIPVASIPGLKETGWVLPLNKITNRKTSSNNTKVNIDELVEPSKLLLVFTCVLQAVRRHDLAVQFLHPIDANNAADYYDVIKFPMDLSTVGQRLNRGYYKTVRLFMADMARIFNNCRQYNAPGTLAHDNANVLERFYQIQMRQLSLWDKPIMERK